MLKMNVTVISGNALAIELVTYATAIGTVLMEAMKLIAKVIIHPGVTMDFNTVLHFLN
jgi:hypothetical protein